MAFTDEQKSELAEMMAGFLTGDNAQKAIRDALRPVVVGIVKSETKTLGESVGAVSTLEERLKKVEEAASKGGGDGEPGSKGRKGAANPELEVLQKQVSKLEAQNAQERTAREAAEQKATDQRRTSAFMSEAGKHLRAGSGKYAYAVIKDQLAENDTGDVVVNVQRDGYEEQVSVEDFLVKDFLTTEEGKLFAPAKGAGGSGGRPGDGSGGAGGGAGSSESEVLERALA